MSTLTLTVSLLIRAGEEAAAAECMRQLEIHSRREPGCLVYNAHRALDNPRRFLIYEIYRDQAALDAHGQSAHFQKYAAGSLYALVEERTAALYGPAGDGAPAGT